ncbi:hypothetical protein T05_3029 [Trichinella murrelli]|uniref:Uncharacterized protein n=1 Tax=Trichinella murrelli TaxID=144512 RepID=A0A0V0SXW2_9BILA|nr:hypothetical protein T05_3029 [Trichinella murrelli]
MTLSVILLHTIKAQCMPSKLQVRGENKMMETSGLTRGPTLYKSAT